MKRRLRVAHVLGCDVVALRPDKALHPAAPTKMRRRG
jgi:hypothetical protein